MNEVVTSLIGWLKSAANIVALLLAFPAALTCWLEERLNLGGEGVYGFWTHVFAMLPGLPGMYLRRAFYALTLQHCSLAFFIGFGAIIFHRKTHVEDEVYIGPYAVVGSSRLHRGCLIGTRASLLSGSSQHEPSDDGRWTSTTPERLVQIDIGEHAWIGEAAIVMADVGAAAMVAAGAVVAAPVPSGIVVAGNPARFVRTVRSEASAARVDEPAQAVARAQPARPYIPFIDWLKCLGMMVIVYGHVAAWAPFAKLAPINAKQLGVACFMFIIGYSLSRETRDRWHVAFNRLFEVYLFAAVLAVILSLGQYAIDGRVQLSNYAPLAGGANVVFDFFPANPTTWFVGTYIHVIVLWALVVHRLRVTPLILAASLIGEIAIRAVLMETAGHMVAYMALPNWSTIFLLGSWYGQRPAQPSRGSNARALLAASLLVVAIAGWSSVASTLPFRDGFPFFELALSNSTVAVLAVSVLVSGTYLALTWLLFIAVRPYAAPRPVRFIARNTLIIFLAHMPVYYLLSPQLVLLGIPRGLRAVILGVVVLVLLAFLSEFITRVLRPRELGRQLYGRWASSRIPAVSKSWQNS